MRHKAQHTFSNPDGIAVAELRANQIVMMLEMGRVAVSPSPERSQRGRFLLQQAALEAEDHRIPHNEVDKE